MGLLPSNAMGYAHRPIQAGCSIQAESKQLPTKVFYYLVAPTVVIDQTLL